MNKDNRKIFYCEDGEYREYCNVCDELCMEDIIKLI